MLAPDAPASWQGASRSVRSTIVSVGRTVEVAPTRIPRADARKSHGHGPLHAALT